MPRGLDGFLRDLSLLRVEGCFNPWGQACPDMDLDPAGAPDARLARLRAHFERTGIQVVLVGEAPGYQGCRYSGMAFTSERLLLEGVIPGVPRLSGRITRRERPWSEPSATILWDSFRSLGIHNQVALWNAFPIHPHKPDEPLSNRTPTRSELEIGGTFVVRLLKEVLPKGAMLVAVGEKAASTLRSFGLEVSSDHCLRHPANGGATKFRDGLAKLFPGTAEQGHLPF